MPAIYCSALDKEEQLTFDDIYEQLKLLSYHVALKETGNRDMAEDAVHNAFESAIKKKDKIFSLSGNARKAYIITAVRNSARDLLRAKNRIEDISVDELDEDITADKFDLSEIAESREGFEYLRQCISSLDEKYKAVFELRYVHDKSNKEIAEILGIKPKNVSTRIDRAKEMLQNMLVGEYHE